MVQRGDIGVGCPDTLVMQAVRLGNDGEVLTVDRATPYGVAWRPVPGGSGGPHAAMHASGGTDPLTPAAIGAAAAGHTHPMPILLRKLADQAFSSTAYADVTDLSFPVLANTAYAFEFVVAWRSAATTTGIAFGINGPASPTVLSAMVETPTTATATAIRHDTAYDQGAASASIDVANTDRLARITGILVTGATAGTLALRCKSEVSGSAVTVRRGSWGRWQ